MFATPPQVQYMVSIFLSDWITNRQIQRATYYCLSYSVSRISWYFLAFCRVPYPVILCFSQNLIINIYTVLINQYFSIKTIKWCIFSDVSPTGVSDLSEGEGRFVQNGGFCCCQTSSRCPRDAVETKASYYVSMYINALCMINHDWFLVVSNPIRSVIFCARLSGRCLPTREDTMLLL